MLFLTQAPAAKTVGFTKAARNSVRLAGIGNLKRNQVSKSGHASRGLERFVAMLPGRSLKVPICYERLGVDGEAKHVDVPFLKMSSYAKTLIAEAYHNCCLCYFCIHAGASWETIHARGPAGLHFEVSSLPN